MDQFPGRAHQAAPLLHLGTAPVNWNNNDIPGWRPVTPFPDILDLMVEAGYSATEYDDVFGTDADLLIREATTRGLTWCGCYQWVDFLDTEGLDKTIENLRPKLDLLRTIDCRHLIVADSLRPHRVALAGRVPADESMSLGDGQVKAMAEGVHKLAETARGYGITIHFHNHAGSWIEAPHELDALLRHLDTDLVDICFDSGHFAYGGGDASTFLAEHIAEVGYLHLKDVDTGVLAGARKRELSFTDALREIVFSPLGRGQADIPAILDQLVTHGFEGWVVIEQDTCAGGPTTTAKNNLNFINTWLSDNLPTRTSTR